MSDFSLENDDTTLYLTEEPGGEYHLTISDGINRMTFVLWMTDVIYMRNRFADIVIECEYEED